MSEQPFKLRLPTEEEWEKLVKITNGNDNEMHWAKMYSWTSGHLPGDRFRMKIAYGYHAARCDVNCSRRSRDITCGFRPVLEAKTPKALDLLQDGAIIRFGTLTMGGEPVSVPQFPRVDVDGDIVAFNGSEISIENTHEDIFKQIRWIKCGDALIADRNLVNRISWEDLDGMGIVKGLSVRLDLPSELLKESHRTATYKTAMELFNAMQSTRNLNDDAFCIARNLEYLTRHVEADYGDIPEDKMYALAERLHEASGSFCVQPLLNEERLDAMRDLLEHGISVFSPDKEFNVTPEEAADFLLCCSYNAFTYIVEETAAKNVEDYSSTCFNEYGQEDFFKFIQNFKSDSSKPCLDAIIDGASGRAGQPHGDNGRDQSREK